MLCNANDDGYRMSCNDYKTAIEDYLNGDDVEDISSLVSSLIDEIDRGTVKIAEKIGGKWVVNEFAKNAILLYLKFNKCCYVESGVQQWHDKIPLKHNDFSKHFYRVVAGTVIRHGVYIGNSSIILPSFINIGANIGANTMIDSMCTIGSCAQIGRNCHIAANVCIGGVLEPVNAAPVIIEDNCFIGASSSITEGVIVEENAVISSGVHLTGSSKIIDTTDGNKIIRGYVPSGSVVVPGTYKISENVSVSASVIIKKVDEKTKKKISINELLRS